MGVGAGEPELAKDARDGIGDDHAAAAAVHVAKNVIVGPLRPQLDAIEQLLERRGQLGV